MKGRAWRAGGLALAALAMAWAPCRAGAGDTPAAQQPAPAEAAPPAPARVPLEHFARLPMFTGVSLSPNGARLAALVNRGEDTLLVTRDVDGGELRALMKTDNLKFRFRWARWVGNERLLVSVIYPGRRGFTGTVEKAVRIQARDGLSLAAYLTHARNGGTAPGPLVLLPHGGPYARDDASFDPWTELLANRGYTVLQVNFRGSSGYGAEFQKAGLQRWGQEMQEDLEDAVQWAVSQGVADPRRICIVGASYGGYAALMGVVKTPHLYRCAVSFAGVSNLTDLALHWTEFIGGKEGSRRVLGNWWQDRERLRATSPALQAQRIEVPVLLVHGTADRRVPVEQSRDMAKALASAGRSYRYMEQEGGDHHFSRQAHHTEFLRELEAFLQAHLAP
ncbi:alpha/beta hydrolase family protein [Azohydromonas australica]|uniref:alpha/beta hydrolase family protein n=1 Tax=Azohydromonas australica TaxID=364039 RepID=UPI000688E027|nr:prolyl oligopeptidase family serine peptidase [Azohydromonas australica]